MKARKPPIRGYDYLKLAWLARRKPEGLIILQDAVMQDFPRQLERAIAQAMHDRKTGAARPMVAFSPYQARMIQRNPALAHPNLPMRIYPFDLVTPSQFSERRKSNIIIWDSAPVVGFDTGRWLKWERAVWRGVRTRV